MQHLVSNEAAAQEPSEAETPWRSATHLRSDAWTQGFASGNRAQWSSGPRPSHHRLILVEDGPECSAVEIGVAAPAPTAPVLKCRFRVAP